MPKLFSMFPSASVLPSANEENRRHGLEVSSRYTTYWANPSTLVAFPRSSALRSNMYKVVVQNCVVLNFRPRQHGDGFSGQPNLTNKRHTFARLNMTAMRIACSIRLRHIAKFPTVLCKIIIPNFFKASILNLTFTS